jgi:hypothetical protein
MTASSRSMLVLLVLLSLPALGTAPLGAAESHDCAALSESALAMPEWYARECGGAEAAPATVEPAGRVPGDTVFYVCLFGGTANPELTRRLLTAPLPTMTYTNIGPASTAPQSIFAVDFDKTATTLWAIDSSCNPTCIGTALGTINRSSTSPARLPTRTSPDSSSTPPTTTSTSWR